MLRGRLRLCGSTVGPRVCISNQLPGETPAAGSQPHMEQQGLSVNFRPRCGWLLRASARPHPRPRCGGVGQHLLAPHFDPCSCSSSQSLSLSGPQFPPLESWSWGSWVALSQSKTWISVPGFRALPRSHALGHRTASPAEGVCQSHPESLRGHLLSPGECLTRAFYSLPTLWKVENHSSEAVGALECSRLTAEKADWPRSPTGPEPKFDWKGTSAVGRCGCSWDARGGQEAGRPLPVLACLKSTTMQWSPWRHL